MLKSLSWSLLLCSLVSFAAFSQQVFLEDFTGNSIPSGWTIANNSGSSVAWEFSTNPSAQGNYPQTFAHVGASTGHVRVDSDYTGSQGTQEDTDLFSPAINCSGLTNVTLGFWEYFRKWQLDTARVYISIDATNWILVHTTGTGLAQSAGTPNPNEVLIDISSIAAGQNTVYIKWNYKGQWDYYWFIDDVEVYQPAAWDVECTAITTPSTLAFAQAPFIISGEFRNLGSQAVNSLTLNYTVNGGGVNSVTVSNISWQPNSAYLLSHATHWNPPSPGVYLVDLWASNLNGNTDLGPANDHAYLTINIPANLATRVVLLEDFVSSSGAPDVQANIDLHDTLNAYPGTHALLKYPMSWPGNGDPYFTIEGQNRQGFYSVSGVPELYIDGTTITHPSQLTGNMLASAQAVPSIMEITTTHQLCPDSQKVSVSVDLNAYTSLASGMTLQVAIIEKTTFNNTGGNGETVFHNIMKKMLPNDQGTTLPAFVNGVPQQFEFDYYFQGSYRLPTGSSNPINHTIEHSVEDFDDLAAVAWVQNNTTLEVFNAAYSTGDSSACAEVVIVDAGADALVCPGNSATLGGNPTATGGTGPYVYFWTPASGLNDQFVANPVASPTVTTTYTVLVGENNGNTASDNVTISVIDNSITIQGQACDTSVTLIAPPGLIAYQWSTGESTQSITVTQSGNYSFVGFHPSGCLLNSPVETVNVGSGPVPTISQSGNVLSTQSFTTYQWYLNGFLLSGATQQSYTIPINGTYTVEVTDAFGCTGISDPFSAQVSAGCAVPSNTSTSNITISSARFNWSAVSGATSYLIRGKASASSSWVYLPISNGTTDFKNVVGLGNGVSYDWQIQTHCNASGTDTSDWSAVLTFTTGCQSPDTTWTDPVTPTGAQLHWNNVAGAQGYEIRGRRIGGGWATVLVGGGNTTFRNVFGLLPSTTYEWAIRTLCNASGTNTSAFTALIPFTTLSGARLHHTVEFSEEIPISASPNPFSEFTNVEFNEPGAKALSLFDVHGKLVRSWNEEEREVTIWKDELAAGIYFLQVKTSKGKHTLKLLVK